MKYIKVTENNYANLEEVSFVYLFESKFTETKYFYWIFRSDTFEIHSDYFNSKDDAIDWFKENIEDKIFEK